MDKEKFTQQVLDAENTLYRIAKTILVNDADCEDAVSEAVLIAWQKRKSLREERYFKTWLVRILINKCYAKANRNARIIPLDETESLAYNSSDYSDLYNAVVQLKKPIKLVVLLYYIEGYSVEETAKILKIPVGTVKSRLHKGRLILKEELKDE